MTTPKSGLGGNTSIGRTINIGQVFLPSLRGTKQSPISRAAKPIPPVEFGIASYLAMTLTFELGI
ncbi:hypothetical protein [Mucilaginibacter gossypiicola]|uniref:hypothetical protein n=1 Tax=Mucilaginibacter gossypiicola TaxID=551995 RepID=UPI00115FFEF3|nr:hypothetical protein [Mucilaginibacter gossypiicola]